MKSSEGVPIKENAELMPEEAEAVNAVDRIRRLSHENVTNDRDFTLHNEIERFLTSLVDKHGEQAVNKCRLYHLLSSSGRTAQNLKGSFFDFTGEDSIAVFCAEKLKEIDDEEQEKAA
jgi:hypothetical protein